MNNNISLETILNELNFLIVYFNKEGQLIYCNDAYLKCIGMEIDQVMGRRPSEYAPNSKNSVFYDLLALLKDGSTPATQIGFSPLTNQWLMIQVFPTQIGAVAVANQATESIVKQHMLSNETLKDKLTGLKNKTSLMFDLDYIYKHKNPKKEFFSIVFIALDGIDIVKNAIGHNGFDLMMMEIASILKFGLEENEEIYIFSESKLILFTTGDAAKRFINFKEKIENEITIAGCIFIMSAFGGYVRSSSNESNPEDLLRQAETALSYATRNHAKRCLEYQDSMSQKRSLEWEIEIDLIKAIKNDELYMVFQPKGDIVTGKTIGAESLIRWKHPIKGIISPYDFLAVAQKRNLMPAIDALVVRKSIIVAAMWKNFGLICPISINLSVDSLCNIEIVQVISTLLKEYDIEPKNFEIEIPEGALINEDESNIEVLNMLVDLGVKLSIDDFGTGYSSFSYITRFPIKTLKIDKSFITQINDNSKNKKIVASIIKMAHSLEFDVVAEGVENIHEMNTTKELNCNTVQGYFYAKPMDQNDFLAFAAMKNISSNRMNPFSI